jgi:hypothetical protein
MCVRKRGESVGCGVCSRLHINSCSSSDAGDVGDLLQRHTRQSTQLESFTAFGNKANNKLNQNASHAAFPMVTLTISPCSNVTLTFDFDFGLDRPVHGGYG